VEPDARKWTTYLTEFSVEEPSTYRECLVGREVERFLPHLLYDSLVESILSSYGVRILRFDIPYRKIGSVEAATESLDEHFFGFAERTALCMHEELPAISPNSTGADGAAGISEICIDAEVVDTAMKWTGDVMLMSFIDRERNFWNEGG
jgi:hypothetical protein